MNKLTKLLSVFVIAGAIGAGVAGVAGCKKSNGHSHKYNYTVDVEDATKHNGVCDCGKNPILKQDHVDTKDNDGICDLCGAPVNPQGGEETTVTSVTVSAAGGATSVAVEGKLQLSATVNGTGSPAQTVTWKSSDDTKATVNASTGEVTGVAEGTVTITATSTVDTSKSGTINLTVTAKGTVDPGPGPVEKSKYEELVEKTNKLYNNDFSEALTAPTFSGTYGSAGVYTSLEGAVTVVNGALTQASGKGANFNTIIDFGPLATGSTLEGYMEVKTTDTGSAWNLIQFKNAGGSTVFVIGAGTDKSKIAYVAGSGICEKLDGKTNTNVAGAVVTEVAFAKDTVYKIYYKFDLQTGKVNLDINGTAVAVDTEINSLGGIQLASSNSGARQVIVDNVVFCGEAMTLAQFKEAKTAALNAAYATYDSANYSTEWYGKIGEAKDTGLQEIGAAQDFAAVNAAYDTAIKAMKDAPTKEGEELFNAKEAYKTTALANYAAYKYTQNKSAYDTAYNKVIAEIDAYVGATGGIAADTKISAAITALAAVKNDETVVSEAKAAAITALEAYRGTEKFETKATEYAAALDAAKGLVNAVTFTSSAETVKADVDAKLAAITAAETDGKAEIDKVKSDAQLLADAKTAADTAIREYRKAEIDALASAAEGSAEESVYKDIQGVIARRTGAVETSTRIEYDESDSVKSDSVNWNVDEAKQNIDSLLESLNKTIEEIKADELKVLKEEYDKAVAAHADIKDHLDKVYNSAVTNINNETEKTEVTNIRIAATTQLNVVIAKDAAYKEIVAYATEVKAELYSNAGKAAIDREIRYDLNSLLTAAPDPSGWSTHMWAIHNSTVISGEDADGVMVGVTVTKQVVLAEIDKIAAAAKAASYEVRLNADGLDQDVLIGKIVYGGTLGGIDVSGLPDDKTIDGGKLYTNEECTAEFDMDTKIYNDTVLYAKLANATKGDITEAFSYADIPSAEKVKDQVLTAADITGKNSFLTLGSGEVRYRLSSDKDANNNFVQVTGEAFKVTFRGTGTLAISGRGTGSSANAAFALLGENGIGCELVSVPGGVTVYDNNVYSIASSGHVKITFKVTNPGTYSIVVLRNGETDPVTKNGEKSTLTFGMGRISAIELHDEYKLQHDVSVVWGSGEAVTYHHGDKITAPNPTGLSDTEKFEYWYYMDGDNEVKWIDGSTLAAGSYTFIAKTSTVAAVATVEASASDETVSIGGSVTLTATAKDEAGNVLEGRTATWSVGSYEYAEVSSSGVLSLLNGAQVGDTITVTATIGTKTATVTLTVKAAAKASYLAADMKAATKQSYAVDEEIANTALFSVSAATALTGSTPAKSQAYAGRDDVGGHTLASADFEKRSSNDILKIEAKGNIKLTIFLTTDKSTLDGARAANVTFKVNGVSQTETVAIGAAKNTIDAVEVTLNSGDVLVLNVTGTSGNSYTAYVFGIEAVGV